MYTSMKLPPYGKYVCHFVFKNSCTKSLINLTLLHLLLLITRKYNIYTNLKLVNAKRRHSFYSIYIH